MNLQEQLAEAEAKVANLKRLITVASCVEAGHDMKHTGGCNAACDNDCICSVPVNTCARCGACDYGYNIEASKIRQQCLKRRS